jgi:hypothetical protein
MSVWVDNRAMSTLGLKPAKWSGVLTAARASRSSVGLAGSAAQLVGALQAASATYLEIEASASLAAFTDRPALAAAIEAAYGGAIRTIRTTDRPNMVTRAVLADLTIGEIPQAVGLTVPRVLVAMRWLRLDGGSMDWPTPGPILVSTTRTPIALGSMPSRGVLLAFGYTSPLVVTYTPASGLGVTTWTITQTLATGEHVAADLDTGDCYLATAAGGRTRLSAVTGTVPVLDPAHAIGTGNPTLSLSTGTALYLAPRRYRL